MRRLVLMCLVSACGTPVQPASHLDQVCESSKYQVWVDLPETGAASRDLQSGIRVQIQNSAWMVGWHPTRTEADLVVLIQEQVAKVEALRRRGAAAAPPTLSIQADKSTPNAMLVQTLRATRAAGLNKVELMVYSNEPVTRVPYPDPAFARELKDQLMALRPEQRQTVLADRVLSEIALCPGANEAFTAVAAAPPEMKCTLMAHGLDEALPGCLLTSTNRVVTLFHVMSEPTYPYRPTAIELVLDDAASPLALEGSTWADSARGLAAQDGKAVSVMPADPATTE